jgi:hypothetical protein
MEFYFTRVILSYSTDAEMFSIPFLRPKNERRDV